MRTWRLADRLQYARALIPGQGSDERATRTYFLTTSRESFPSHFMIVRALAPVFPRQTDRTLAK